MEKESRKSRQIESANIYQNAKMLQGQKMKK